MPRRLAANRRIRLALILASGFAAACILGAYALGLDPLALAHRVKTLWIEGQSQLQGYATVHPALAPVLLFAAVATLPTFLLPVSPLLALCGAALGPKQGTLIAGLGMMTNAIVTFVLARKGRLWVEPRILRAGYAIPRLTAGNAGLLIVPMRIIPGVPFVVQNYLLGLAGTPVKTFLFWIALIEIPCACPYVLVGAGAAQADTWLLASGAALMLAAAVLAHILMRRRKTDAPADA